MMSKLSVKEIHDVLIDKYGLSRQDAETFVSTLFDVISEGLHNDKSVKVRGLGTFKLVDVRERESVNVNTGERVTIDSHSKISFTPDPVLRDIVNKPFAQFDTVVLNEGVDLGELDKAGDYIENEFSEKEQPESESDARKDKVEPASAEDTTNEDEIDQELKAEPGDANIPQNEDVTSEPTDIEKPQIHSDKAHEVVEDNGESADLEDAETTLSEKDDAKDLPDEEVEARVENQPSSLPGIKDDDSNTDENDNMDVEEKEEQAPVGNVDNEDKLQNKETKTRKIILAAVLAVLSIIVILGLGYYLGKNSVPAPVAKTIIKKVVVPSVSKDTAATSADSLSKEFSAEEGDSISKKQVGKPLKQQNQSRYSLIRKKQVPH